MLEKEESASSLGRCIPQDVTLPHSQPSLQAVDQLECTNIATHKRLAALTITEELIDDPVNIIH
ncbi:hypothetical protein E2C01_033535 [Portunus trituberculatus]|uniref:Uncharacterized protein n=1 Tax=Portunus trituberculatus TaxID=210409 RepID=A0A5B7F0D4_PORTR|nr:hypothetical protein [Portunus trituberculatus]